MPIPQPFPYHSELRAEWMAEGHAEGHAEGLAEGLAEGSAKTILLFLAARGIALSSQGRAKITSCTDKEQLRTWAVRATTITSEEELFG